MMKKKKTKEKALEENNQEIKEEIIDDAKEKNIKNPEIKTKQNKQIAIAVFLMVFVVVMVFLVPFAIKNYFNKFSYINLDFTKQKYGEVIFYNTVIPIVDNNGKIIQDYELDFRSDPRKIEYIKVNISEGDLKVIRNKITYISVVPDVQECEDNVIAMASFSRFLGGFAQLNVRGASANESYAKEFNTTYANCETKPDSTVIIIKSGNQTRIDKTNKNCYELTYANCDIIAVTEKFNLEILRQYMEMFERK